MQGKTRGILNDSSLVTKELDYMRFNLTVLKMQIKFLMEGWSKKYCVALIKTSVTFTNTNILNENDHFEM